MQREARLTCSWAIWMRRSRTAPKPFGSNPSSAVRLRCPGPSFYTVQGQIADEAIGGLQRGIRLDPKFAWAYRTRSILYREKGELENALADINEAVRLDPKNGGILCERGVLQRSLEELEKALADFEEAIRLAPSAAFPYLAGPPF